MTYIPNIQEEAEALAKKIGYKPSTVCAWVYKSNNLPVDKIKAKTGIDVQPLIDELRDTMMKRRSFAGIKRPKRKRAHMGPKFKISREELTDEVEKFLAKGGKIKQMELGPLDLNNSPTCGCDPDFDKL